jgi:hypothetical protein
MSDTVLIVAALRTEVVAAVTTTFATESAFATVMFPVTRDETLVMTFKEPTLLVVIFMVKAFTLGDWRAFDT